MSNDFNIQVKVDPGSSTAKIKEVGDTLAQTEIKLTKTQLAAKAVGEALFQMGQRMASDMAAGAQRGMAAFSGLANAIEQERTALQRADQIHRNLGWAKLNEALEREGQALERIHGPAREYMADLEALDRLLAKNAISTQQYAEQVTGLNARMGETPQTQAGPSLGSGASALMGAIGGSAAVAGLLQVGRGVENLIHEYEQLEDRYTTLTNSLVKYIDANHTLDVAMREQRGIADDLHTTMHESVGVFDAVVQATADLNLTRREQIQLTKELGEAAELSNRPIAASGDILARLVLALDSGAGAGRALRSIMIEFPSLAKAWEQQFHTNEAGLMALAEAGKLSADTLVAATLKSSDAIHEQHEKIRETNEQARAQLQETANVYMNQGVNAAIAFGFASNKAAQDAAEHIHRLTDQSYGAQKAIEGITAALADTAAETQRLLDLGDPWKNIKQNPGVHFTSGSIMDRATQALGLGADIVSGLARIPEARKELERLRIEYQSGAVDSVNYREQYDHLMTVLNDGRLPETIRLWEAIHDPIEAYGRSTAALNELLKAGRIDLAQYNEELEKVISNAPKAALGNTSTAELTRAHLRRAGEFVPQLDVSAPDDAYEAPQTDLAAKRAQEIMDQTVTSIEKYKQERDEINGMNAIGYLTDENAARALANLRDRYTEAGTGAEAYAKALKKIEEARKAGLISDAAADEKELRLRIQNGQGTVADGMKAGWEDVLKEAGNTAGQIEADFKTAFQGVESALEDFVLHGKNSLGDLANSLESMLFKLAFNGAVSGIGGLLGGGGDVVKVTDDGGAGYDAAARRAAPVNVTVQVADPHSIQAGATARAVVASDKRALLRSRLMSR